MLKRRKPRAPGNGLRSIIAAALILAHAPLDAAPPNPSGAATPCAIQWQHNPERADQFFVSVSGLSVPALKGLREADWPLPQWQQLLSVHADQAGLVTNSGLPPMLGSYRISGDALVFQPQFPLAPGVTYRAVLDPNHLPGANGSAATWITAVCSLPPRASSPTTVVTHVYPTAGVLPENLLKFYLHFSAPMSRGNIYDYIHLRDEMGKDVELPFLEIGEELWDPAMTRLTLFIDPGRIKRGVRPLEEVGPALQQGKRYALVIDPAWKDGMGNPLKKGFRKSFKVAPPDRQPPDPALWKIRAPNSGTRQPISLTFPKPMDQALAQRVIHVTTESGRRVQGQTTLQGEERHWTFVPDAPWPRGAHQLLVETTIEDLAGNNVGKPFEVDLFSDPPDSLTNLTVRLRFQIR